MPNCLLDYMGVFPLSAPKALDKNQQWLAYDQQREAYVKAALARVFGLEQQLNQAKQALTQKHNEAHSDGESGTVGSGHPLLGASGHSGHNSLSKQGPQDGLSGVWSVYHGASSNSFRSLAFVVYISSLNYCISLKWSESLFRPLLHLLYLMPCTPQRGS